MHPFAANQMTDDLVLLHDRSGDCIPCAMDLDWDFFFLFPGAQKQLIPIWQIDESSDEGMFIV